MKPTQRRENAKRNRDLGVLVSWRELGAQMKPTQRHEDAKGSRDLHLGVLASWRGKKEEVNISGMKSKKVATFWDSIPKMSYFWRASAEASKRTSA